MAGRSICNIYCRCILAIAICLLSTSVLAQEKRIALVIGNAAYANLPPLSNPIRDAEAIGQSLSSIGFTVFLTTNLDQKKMRKAIHFFLSRAEDADTALFYFSGHGATLAGHSYLFPTNFGKADLFDIQEAFDLEELLTKLGSDLRSNLVFIDACRENLAQSGGFSNDGLFATSHGPRESAKIGTLISFATTPGHTAFDGDGLHSPFTGALLDHLETPGIDIELMLKQVRRDVVVNSGGRQVPWAESSLLSSFQLAPRAIASGEMRDIQDSPEQANPSLLTVLSNTGFSQKPILQRISTGLGSDDELTLNNTLKGGTIDQVRSARITALLCKVLKPPLPENCRPLTQP